MVDIGQLGIIFPNTALSTTRSFVKSNRDTVVRLLRALGEGQHRLRSDKDFSMKVLSKYTKTTDPERAAAVCRRLEGLRELRVVHGELTFTLADGEGTIALTRALADAGIGIASLVPEEATLEALFFRLTEPETAGTEVGGVAA